MPKRITLKDEEYFKLLELKVKYKTDSLFAIMNNLSNTQPPNSIQQNKVKVPRWLTEKNIAILKSICRDIEDDASEQNAEDELSYVQSQIKGWKAIGGNDGLRDLREYRAEQKAKNIAPAQDQDQIVVDQEASNF